MNRKNYSTGSRIVSFGLYINTLALVVFNSGAIFVVCQAFRSRDEREWLFQALAIICVWNMYLLLNVCVPLIYRSNLRIWSEHRCGRCCPPD